MPATPMERNCRSPAPPPPPARPNPVYGKDTYLRARGLDPLLGWHWQGSSPSFCSDLLSAPWLASGTAAAPIHMGLWLCPSLHFWSGGVERNLRACIRPLRLSG